MTSLREEFSSAFSPSANGWGINRQMDVIQYYQVPPE